MGRVRMQVPMLYVVAFVITFVIGGLSGVMIAAVPLDLQLHDSYFIVAHFHYVLIGGAVFPLLGAITYWFPKFTGRIMSTASARCPSGWSSWLPAGLLPDAYRRAAWHAAAGLHLSRGHGAGGPQHAFQHRRRVVALAMLLFLINMAMSLRGGATAEPNPWGAPTLEWATTSPPPRYNFAHIPVVDSRTPLWDSPGLSVVARPACRRARAAADQRDRRDPRPARAERPAEPMAVHRRPRDHVMFISSIFSPWGLLFGAVPAAIALIAWFWPKDRHRTRAGDHMNDGPRFTTILPDCRPMRSAIAA